MHLGQVVVVRDDFYILDFEGEPLRNMEERAPSTRRFATSLACCDLSAMPLRRLYSSAATAAGEAKAVGARRR